MDGEKIQDRLAGAWVYIAKRYVSPANVIGADILSEPYQDHDAELAALYRNVGAAIATAGRRNRTRPGYHRPG